MYGEGLSTGLVGCGYILSTVDEYEIIKQTNIFSSSMCNTLRYEPARV